MRLLALLAKQDPSIQSLIDRGVHVFNIANGCAQFFEHKDRSQHENRLHNEGVMLPFPECIFVGGNEAVFFAREVESGPLGKGIELRMGKPSFVHTEKGTVIDKSKASLVTTPIIISRNGQMHMRTDERKPPNEMTTLYMRTSASILVTILFTLEEMETEYVPANEKANVRREKKGKLPTISHHVLKLRGKKRRKEDHGGSHASPAMHARRGHFRRYETGAISWVRPTIVGKPENGITFKTYEIDTRSHSHEQH